jgi:hypothetical protein
MLPSIRLPSSIRPSRPGPRRATARGRLPALVLLALSFGALAPSTGCSKENNVTTNNNNTYNTTNNVTQVLGAQGGFVENIPVGGRLDLPPGALTQDVTLVIGELADPTQLPLPSGVSPVSKIISFEPHGQTFALDVNLTVAHSAGSRTDVSLLRAEPMGSWQAVPHSDLTAAQIQRSTSTLSFYVAVVPTNPAGASGSGGEAGAGGSAGASSSSSGGADVGGGSGGEGVGGGASCDTCAGSGCMAAIDACQGDPDCADCYAGLAVGSVCASSSAFQAVRTCGCSAGCDVECPTLKCSGGTGGAGAGGDAGAGGTAGGGGTAGASGAAGECGLPTECPGTDTECSVRTCTKGVCGQDFTPAGTATVAQTTGDCTRTECDGNGGVANVPDDLDGEDDSNPCTDDVCSSGTQSHPPKPINTPCGAGRVCDAGGSCLP